MKKSTPNILGTVLNPPSIPSHLSVFGYEENPSGQLVQQKSNQVGFSGNPNDKVGPGDYDVVQAKTVVSKNVTGVVAWKKPVFKAQPVVNADGEKEPPCQLPGPGDYNIEVERPNTKQASSMFVSKV